MIRSGTLLDTDIGTLARALAAGWRWWIDEMAGMMPAALRPRPGIARGQRLRWDGTRLTGTAGGPLPQPGRASVLIDAELVLTRVVERPALPLADLKRLIALDLDRLTPFAAGDAYYDVAVLGPGVAPGTVAVAVSVMPKPMAAALATACAEAGVVPRAIGVTAPGGDTLAADFAAPLRADGLIPAGSRAAPYWWGLVALLFVLNLGLFVYQDIARLRSLQALVDNQAPTASAARTLATRIQQEETRRRTLIAERQTRDPLAVLSLTSRTLPRGVWIERLAWDNGSYRISGYKPASLNLLKLLRDSGRFDAIRTTVADVATEAAEGEPFDISAGRVRAQ